MTSRRALADLGEVLSLSIEDDDRWRERPTCAERGVERVWLADALVRTVEVMPRDGARSCFR